MLIHKELRAPVKLYRIYCNICVIVKFLCVNGNICLFFLVNLYKLATYVSIKYYTIWLPMQGYILQECFPSNGIYYCLP